VRVHNTKRFTRVVATVAAIDKLVDELVDKLVNDRVGEERNGLAYVIRLAPDEVLIGGDGFENGTADVDDVHAIVESDCSFSSFLFDHDEFARTIAPCLEWQWNPDAGVGQGLLMQVPIKVHNDRQSQMVMVLCSTASAHELAERLA
jgi:hypothetical protein